MPDTLFLDRTQGRSAFGTDPAGYDRGRPAYPVALFERLGERFGLNGARAFEVGPGTGQASASLLNAGVASLVAIEPDARLAGFLADRLDDPRLTVRVAPFEEARLAPGGFDIGFAATSFHWLDQPAALARVRAALKPGGGWAMWWNAYFDPTVDDPFRDATQPLFEALGTPRGRGMANPRPFALQMQERLADLRAAGFADIVADRFEQPMTLDRAGIEALYSTFSQVRLLGEEERKALIGAIGDIVDQRFGGKVRRMVWTPCYTAMSR